MSINSLRRATLQGLLVLASQPLWPAISGSAEGGAAAAGSADEQLGLRLRRLIADSEAANALLDPLPRAAVPAGSPAFVDPLADSTLQRQLAQARADLRALEGIDRNRLGPTEQIARDVLNFSAGEIVRRHESGLVQLALAAPLDSMSGLHVELPDYVSGAGAPFNTAEDYQRGLERLQGFAQHLESVRQRASAALDQGYRQPAVTTAKVLAQLQADLKPLCRADLIGPCASVSVVGRNIRSILHQLGGALELFAEQRIHLVSQAANDLNLTFVVDENQGDRLVEGLHELLIRPVRDDAVIGPTWERLFGSDRQVSETNVEPWWQLRRSALLELMQARDCSYVYDVATVLQRCTNLRSMKSLSRVSYAMKANSSPELLRVIHSSGLKIECVSIGEIERAFEAIPALQAEEVLFTPNFAPREEYAAALARGVHVTLDNLHPLEHWPELFKGRSVFVRIDPGSGRGHHQHVRTGGIHSKFGVAQEDAARFAAAAKSAGATVVGLHAHAGSGVHDIDNWTRTARLLLALRETFPQVRVIDVGGGIGVPDRQGGSAFDMAGLDAALLALDFSTAGVELWMEPGRYVVAEAGVLLAKVTQTKTKGAAGYVGVATGMNSLIRPALYGAHHDIVNLSRLGETADGIFDVVGPICETGDVLGHDRALPTTTVEGDILLIATTGAYGASMASHYNLRSPAEELLLR